MMQIVFHCIECKSRGCAEVRGPSVKVAAACRLGQLLFASDCDESIACAWWQTLLQSQFCRKETKAQRAWVTGALELLVGAHDLVHHHISPLECTFHTGSVFLWLAVIFLEFRTVLHVSILQKCLWNNGMRKQMNEWVDEWVNLPAVTQWTGPRAAVDECPYLLNNLQLLRRDVNRRVKNSWPSEMKRMVVISGFIISSAKIVWFMKTQYPPSWPYLSCKAKYCAHD